MKFGVIGMGSAGVRHARNLMQLGHRVFAYDPHVTEAAKSCFNYIDDAVKLTEQVDAVVIASPTESHVHFIGHAIVAKKHIFVEKPIASIYQIDHLRCLLQEAAAQKLVVQVGCNQRFNKGIIVAKQQLMNDQSPFGGVRYAIFTCSQANTKYTEDVETNWGAHEVDLAQHILGPIVDRRFLLEGEISKAQQAHFAFKHRSGALSFVNLDYFGNPEYRHALIHCERGFIDVDLVKQTIILAKGNGSPRENDMRNGNIDHTYVAEMRVFIDSINAGQPTSYAATGWDGLRTLQAIAGKIGY